MTKKRSTKRALALSFISLLLCVSMFVGTTFAWFTDSVSSLNNKIVAGNLDVELEFAKVVDGTITGWTTVQGNGEIFDPKALWEPGRVEVVYLKVSNLGTLALKYQLGVNVYGEIIGKTEDGKDIKLSEHLVFKVVDLDAEPTVAYTREEAIKEAGAVKGLKDYNGTTKALDPKDGANDEDYVALIVYMPETVGNEANYRGDKVPTITLGINLYATQVEAESDSFGDDYDADAWHPDMTVYNEADLKAALATGGNIELGADVEISSSVEVPAGVTVTLNLNGKTITGTKGRDADNNRVHVLVNNGNLSLVGGTVESAGVNGGSAIYNAEGAILTVDKVTLNGAPQNGSTWPSYTVNNYGTLTVTDSYIYGVQGIIATNNTANTTVNNVIAYRDGWSSGHVFYNSSSAKVTINGGTYTNDGNGVDGTMIYSGETVINDGTFIVKEGAYFALLSGSKLTVNGGDFNGIKSCLAWGGTMTVSGGSFGFDPSAYVAAGYKAFETADNGYIVLPDTVSGLIYNADQLKAAGKNGGEYVVMADVTLADANNVTVENELVIDLNGYSIKGCDTTSTNFGLISVNPGKTLTINDSVGTGAIVLNATINSGWGRYSSVISNQRGTVVVNGGTIKHLGGTDMAYAIDNLTNTGAEPAKTVINGGTIVSSYIGIRQFCNSATGLNEVEINDGTVSGVRRSVWMQNPNANVNLAKLTINGGTLNGVLTIGAENFEVKVNGGNFTDLATAVAYATNGTTVGLAADYAGNVTVTQKPDVKITVDGNGNTFAGVITVDGKSATYTTAGLTLKNIVFKADSVSADACIQLGNGTNATRYTCNVTVDGCTFDVPGVVGVKSYTGGDKNVQIIGCTATANAHSLAQLKGVDGVLVKGCTVNSVRGVNFNNSDNVVVDNCTFDVEKYALRFGESGNTTVENYEVKNCTITSANGDGDAAIVLRAGATNANLTITNTSIAAGVQMSGHENANITIQ